MVTAADKARYDVMFHNADLDKDGFVSGQEIKGVFLQSGLPQMVLAHIWYVQGQSLLWFRGFVRSPEHLFQFRPRQLLTVYFWGHWRLRTGFE